MYCKTARLELKPMEERDLPALAELLSDETVKKTYMVPDFENREAALALAKRIQSLSQDPSRYIVGIYLGQNLIGMMNDTEVVGDVVEVGYALLPAYYNQGYATEAFTAVIAYLLQHGFRQVIAGAFEGNLASLRVMAKSGMTLLSREDYVQYRGVNHRCIYYGKPAEI
jgi:RimJ/RimL family protein N-acetyltransferase